jgi:D-methionine transport system ATP-binding protein
MIEIKHLTKKFNTKPGTLIALDDVSLNIPKGKIFGIIGPSGAGKSTLLRTINMLERPTSGEVLIEGENIVNFPERKLRQLRKNIGMIFQHFNLLTSRTVCENIAFPMEIAGATKKQVSDRIQYLLPLVGLEDKAHTYVSNLSGGQKQRVGIARALANNPKILLCDEATSALDPQTTQSILELLEDINRKLGLTIVIITHEMHVIKEICDYVAIIQNGRIAETNTVIGMFTNPKTQIAKDIVLSIVNGGKQKRLIDEGILNISQPGVLIRAAFVGQSAGQPVITEMIKRFDVSANILYGNIDTIKDVPFGTLLIELTGTHEKIAASIDYAKSRKVGIEVLSNV